ncbi:hypothetical protein GCM10010954_24740 [Halobacillus andaensis]|uniref:Uncharacterized protein n=1 Tax=Halobacillus andaensis TaxID=1176239 RepID=A0A917B649_HALAA|nr:hypothetical protein [Halobacillus andaensis]MBP2005938.1 hypothetical protein [Halobacillus andaensis]GGF24867.1 hypothetical protein GCM10010954_24740 [Halobacillus andaensis]
MNRTTILKWISGVCEGLLAIPIAGGTFIVSMSWTPLLFMFALHTVTLILSIKDARFSAGSILGMITSFIGAIPIIGWVMHTITALVLLIDAAIETKN